MEKYCVFNVRKWEKHDQVTDKDVVKFFYSAFDRMNKPLEFSSDRGDIKVEKGLLAYDSTKAQELSLEAVFDSFKGKMKYKEISVDNA